MATGSEGCAILAKAFKKIPVAQFAPFSEWCLITQAKMNLKTLKLLISLHIFR